MMSSLSSAVSGLKAHQQKMDVISNNISNVSTIGYKSSRVTFSDVLSQTLSGATAPNTSTGKGGINPKQLGLGVGVASIDTLTTAGSLESTGNQTDLAIEGNGYFIVRNGDSGSYLFTRAGDFSVDKSGNLVNGSGLNVYGWTDYGGAAQSDGTYKFDAAKTAEAINIYSDSYNGNKKSMAAKATTNASFTGTLASSTSSVSGATSLNIGTLPTDADYTTTATAIDSLGNEHEVELKYYKGYADSTGTEWYWTASNTDGSALSGATSGYLKFDTSGKIITTDSTNYNTTPSLTITPSSSSGASALSVKLDFSNITMSNEDSSVTTKSVDGYKSGTLEDLTIGSDGVIMGTYSNGKEQPLGKVALATFNNPGGLTKVGSNTYAASVNSGDYENGVPAGSNGTGNLSSGYLESSNVDLSKELSDMIVTERGFQANSRVVTTADEMLQVLVNLGK